MGCAKDDVRRGKLFGIDGAVETLSPTDRYARRIVRLYQQAAMELLHIRWEGSESYLEKGWRGRR